MTNSDFDPGINQTVAPEDTQVPEEQSRFTRGRTAIALGVVAAVGVAGIAFNSCSTDDESSTPTTDKDAKEMCDNFEDANAAADGSKYNTPQAFFPKTGEIDKADQVKGYIQSLFNENGPLAGNGDEASLAAIMSMVVVPAHDGAVADTSYDYVTAYNAKIAAYQGENGKKVAVEDCKEAWATLGQVSELDDNWAQEGEVITEIQAVRDVDNADKSKQNDIIGMTLVQNPSLATLRGIKFKLGKTSKDLDGFNELLLSTNEDGSLDGRIFGKGLSQGNVSLDPNGAPLVSMDESGNPTEIRLMPDGTIEVKTVNKDTGEVTVTTGPAPGNVDTGGSAGPNGDNPEAGPGGVTDSPAVGGGNNPGTTPGTTPGGHGTTTVVTSPPTLPPMTVTIPPTTRPPQTTTTQPQTTTTQKGSETTVVAPGGGTAPN